METCVRNPEHICRLSARRITELPASGKTAAGHFLGAIVLQAPEQQPGDVQQWSVVDGQQRLTTLQLPTNPAAAQLEDRGHVSVSHLVAARLLAPGTELHARDDGLPSASVTQEGLLQVNGRIFESPSGVGRALAGHAVNGWYYWRLGDGRRLKDVRDNFLRSGGGAS